MVTWYQVYKTDNTIFGFKTDGFVVLDHPDRSFVGMNLQLFTSCHLVKTKVNQVSKISDIFE